MAPPPNPQARATRGATGLTKHLRGFLPVARGTARPPQGVTPPAAPARARRGHRLPHAALTGGLRPGRGAALTAAGAEERGREADYLAGSWRGHCFARRCPREPGTGGREVGPGRSPPNRRRRARATAARALRTRSLRRGGSTAPAILGLRHGVGAEAGAAGGRRLLSGPRRPGPAPPGRSPRAAAMSLLQSALDFLAGPGSLGGAAHTDFVGQTVELGDLRLRVRRVLAEGEARAGRSGRAVAVPGAGRPRRARALPGGAWGQEGWGRRGARSSPGASEEAEVRRGAPRPGGC